MRLSDLYIGEEVYVDAPVSLVPTEAGSGVGASKTTGAISGFSYQEYPRIDQGKLGSERMGLVLLAEIDNLNGTPAIKAPWRNAILELFDVQPKNDVFTIGVPLLEKPKIARVGSLKVLPDNVDQFLELAESTPDEFSYQDYVRRVDKITGGQPLRTASEDMPLLGSVQKIIKEMVASCPYLGSSVVIDSRNIRRPSPKKVNAYNIWSGSAQGILRKFIYGVYFEQGEARSGIQAVIYAPKIADLVYAGKLSAATADALPSTSFIPLSLPHELIVLQPESR